MKLQPTLTGQAPAIDVASVLQILESARACGTFRLGAYYLRLRNGQVCKASGEPVATVAAILAAKGSFEFRLVQGEPTGVLALSVTGLLLEAARLADEAAQVPTA